MLSPASRAMCLWRVALLMCVSLLLLTSCGNPNEPAEPLPVPDESETTIILLTDSDEWRIQVFKEHLYYSEAASITLPAPYRLPNRDEAKVLRQLTFSWDERFVTSDGYTFGMPSASVSKAGSKTQYSLLGLWRRRTVIVDSW